MAQDDDHVYHEVAAMVGSMMITTMIPLHRIHQEHRAPSQLAAHLLVAVTAETHGNQASGPA